jgi:site-specific recombinase XerD
MSILEELRDASRARQTRKSAENWCKTEPDEYGKKGNYIEWCENHGKEFFPCPVEQMEAFLVHVYELGYSITSVKHAKWAIDSIHKRMDLDPPGKDPRIEIIMSGIIRTKVQKGEGVINQKDALTIDHIKKVDFPGTPTGIRDKAMLLIGFAGGFRKSELAMVQIQDIKKIDSGINIELPFSKTNQQAEKVEKITIVYGSDPNWCPILSMLKWLELVDQSSGPIFRSITRYGRIRNSLASASIPVIIKKYAAMAGLDPVKIAGHSLRVGCATYMLDKGVPAHIVQKHMRHKSFDSTQKYNRNQTGSKLEGVY